MAVSRAAHRGSFQATTPSDREIVFTRLFDAPPQLVFDAMTIPEHVKQWWGALDDRHSMPVCEIDLRPGGAWRFVGRGPDGEYGFHGVYKEVEAPGRLVFTEIFDPFPEAESLVTQLLAEEDGRTRLTVTMQYPSQEVRDAVLQTGMTTGAGISYERLEDLVLRLQA